MNGLRRLYDAIVEGLVPLAGLVLAAVCLLIAWDVVARNVGLQPPESTVALTEYALLYVTMAAAPALVRRRGHVVVELVYRRIGGRARRLLDRLIPAGCAAISFLVAGLAVALAMEAVHRGEVDTRSFDIPRAWLFGPLVFGFGLMGTEFLRLALIGPGAGGSMQGRTAL